MTNSSAQFSFDIEGNQKPQLSPRHEAFQALSSGIKPPTKPIAKKLANASTPYPKRRKHVKPPSPLSIRWTWEEKNDLVARAGDVPVSAYVKSVLFSDAAKPARLSPRNPLLDHQLLGQILAQLGRNAFAPDLAVLAEAVRSGSLPLDEITTNQIEQSVSDIAKLRRTIMEALGKRI